MKKIAFSLLLLALSEHSLAEWAVEKHVRGIRAYPFSSVHFIKLEDGYLDSTSATPSPCANTASTGIYYLDDDSQAYTLLVAAIASNSTVWVSSNSCDTSSGYAVINEVQLGGW